MFTFCYTALSPFCRKVRMGMEFKKLQFELSPGDNPRSTIAWNPRAEVPILIDGDRTVHNSPDIFAYLDRKFPTPPLYPVEASLFAEVRQWERFADSHVGAIMTTVANWRFADLPPMPSGLVEAAQRDAAAVYDRLQEQLGNRQFVCGDISAADFALYPHISAGAALSMPCDPGRHPSVIAWLKRMRARAEGQSDMEATRQWWANKDNNDADTDRVNWGTFRLEWLLANGGTDWFAEQVRQDKVLWSSGPKNNAYANPNAPAWAKPRG